MISRNKPVPPLAAALLVQIDELSRIMIAERELVINRDMEPHKELLKRKQKLALEYRASLKALAAQPELLKGLPRDLTEKLKSGAQKLAEAADGNAKLLRTALLAVQRLIQNVISIVKSENLTKPTYSDPRTAHLALGTYSPTCTPLAVNRTA